MLQRRPLRDERDRQHKRKPERHNKNAAPQRTLKPRKLAAAADWISTFAQRIDDSCVFENGKLLPEKDIDEKATEHPNLQAEQSQREKDHKHRRAPGGNHSCDQECKYDQQEENAIDEDAQRRDARPEPYGFIEGRKKSGAAT